MHLNGTEEAVDQAVVDALFTFHPGDQIAEEDHYLLLQADYFGFAGNFTVTLNSSVREAGGEDSDVITFDLEVKHWCTMQQLETFAIAD